MATFLALVATTMGIGALYYGLPQARYRKKLLDEIAEALRSQSYSGEFKERIEGKLRADKTFADHFHYLAMWYSQLPASTRTSIKGTVADVFDSVSVTAQVPYFYRWFRYNADKYVCLVAAVFIPLVCLWLFHYVPHIVKEYVPYCELWLAFAQVLVIVNMVYGTVKTRGEAVAIRNRLSIFVTKLSQISETSSTRKN